MAKQFSTQLPLCGIYKLTQRNSIDFKDAFHKMSHTFLFNRSSNQCGLMVFNSGVVPVKATETLYKDFRIEYVRQMNTAMSWFLWKGAIFKVPLSTLQRPKESGGRALIYIMAKCMTLFVLRMEKQGLRTDTFTADCLTKWRLHGRTPNPPQIKRIPTKFDYLYRYNIESAYAPTRRTSEQRKTYKRRLYTALLTSTLAAAGFPELCVQNLWPSMDWECIIRICTYETNLWTTENLQKTTLHSPPNECTSRGWISWTARPNSMAQCGLRIHNRHMHLWDEPLNTGKPTKDDFTQPF